MPPSSQKKLAYKISIKMPRTAEFDADFESMKKVVKKISAKKFLAWKCMNFVLFHHLVQCAKVLNKLQ
jgi:hypothetical protein